MGRDAERAGSRGEAFGCSVWRAGRRQRHSIAGQMSYLKMLGLGARGKLAGAAGLFSTAVISGSSSAPNLRVMIPSDTTSNTLECFGGVPAIRPLETLHNALSLRQLDAFLERVTAAPVLLGTPPSHQPPASGKRHSPTNSAGWSGPSSLMSSSGEMQSGVSSAGPSSPTSAHMDPARLADSNWSKNVPSKLPLWDGEAATLCAYDPALHTFTPHTNSGSCISGDVTPVSAASELEFNSNEATAGSGTDHELLSAEGEDDEDTLSVDACSSPMRIIKNDLTPHSPSFTVKLDSCQPSTSNMSADLYGLSFQQTKEDFYKDIPSSSTNYNSENEAKNKCIKDERSNQWSNLDSLNLQSKDNNKQKTKRGDVLNNGSRRYSDSSAQKSNHGSQVPVAFSRFTTTLVDESQFRASTSGESKPNNNNQENASEQSSTPVVTKAKNCNVKAGFHVSNA